MASSSGRGAGGPPGAPPVAAGSTSSTTVSSSEVVLVNGTPLQLNGPEGDEIRRCLLQERGRLPSQSLLDGLLREAGLMVRPRTRVQAELKVTQTLRHKETAAVKNQQGHVHEVLSKAEQVITEHHDSRVCISPGTEDADYNAPPLASSTPKRKYNSVNLLRAPELLLRISPNDNDDDDNCGEEEELLQYDVLLWSRLFATPSSTLTGLCGRFDSLLLLSEPEDPRTVALVSQMLRVVSRWLTWFPEDFQDESMMRKTKRLFVHITELQRSTSAKLSQLLQTASSHLSAMRRHEQALEKAKEERKKKDFTLFPFFAYANSSNGFLHIHPHLHSHEESPGHQKKPPFRLPPPSETASEMTRLECAHLEFLGAAELLSIFAKDKEKEEPSGTEDARFRTAKRCSNYDRYVEWFNRLSYLVATTVCKMKKKKRRVKLIEFWIEVARECINLGNFNSLMGIISGLNMFPVARLKKTWRKIARSGKFAVLEHQLDPTANFKSYRSTLDAAVVRSAAATDDRQRIVVPFFTLFVKDLFIEKETLDLSFGDGTSFNLVKARALSRRIREFCRWKEVNCPYEKRPRTADFLLKAGVLEDEELDYESYTCEAPVLPHEKTSFKQMKEKYKQEHQPRSRLHRLGSLSHHYHSPIPTASTSSTNAIDK